MSFMMRKSGLMNEASPLALSLATRNLTLRRTSVVAAMSMAAMGMMLSKGAEAQVTQGYLLSDIQDQKSGSSSDSWQTGTIAGSVSLNTSFGGSSQGATVQSGTDANGAQLPLAASTNGTWTDNLTVSGPAGSTATVTVNTFMRAGVYLQQGRRSDTDDPPR